MAIVRRIVNELVKNVVKEIRCDNFMKNILDKNFRMKKADYEQMKKDIRKALNEVDKPLSFKEIAEKIGSDEYTVLNMVGIYFKDLTGDALSKVAMYNMPDDDFYLYYQKIEYINSNKDARRFFEKINKQIDRNIKAIDFKGRLTG